MAEEHGHFAGVVPVDQLGDGVHDRGAVGAAVQRREGHFRGSGGAASRDRPATGAATGADGVARSLRQIGEFLVDDIQMIFAGAVVATVHPEGDIGALGDLRLIVQTVEAVDGVDGALRFMACLLWGEGQAAKIVQAGPTPRS